MAQRLRRPSPGQGPPDKRKEAVLVQIGEASEGPAGRQATTGQHLNPAPRHPLYDNNPSTTRLARPSYERAISSSSSNGLTSRKGRGSGADRKNNQEEAYGQHLDSDVDGGNYKGHRETVQAAGITTLDRLEGWFGIAGQGPSSSTYAAGGSSSSSPAMTTTQKQHRQQLQPPTTRLVLVHSITSSDTLASLALKYKTAVGTLRRANGLWIGDSVQSRKELFIPLEDDTEEGRDTLGAGPSTGGRPARARAMEDGKGKLSLIEVGQGNGGVEHIDGKRGESEETMKGKQVSNGLLDSHERSLSSSSNSTTSLIATEAEIRRVPSQAMSYFPSAANSALSKGKARSFDGDEAKGREGAGNNSFGFALGISPFPSDQAQDPGESGVEDLLRLAERARLRGDEGEDTVDELQRRKTSLVPSTDPSVRRASTEDVSRTSESAASTSAARDHDDWKPNKWTFGAPRARRKADSSTAPSTSSVTSSPESSYRPVLAALTHPSTSSSATETSSPPRSASYMSGNGGTEYQGWNDIPEPPLSRTAQGKVAHAYKANTRRKYPRPDGTFGETKGAAMIEDLAAGLPPNPGPASNWARPIHDCLPLPESSNGRAKVIGHGTSSLRPHASHANLGAFGTAKNAGWSQLLSDTFRGRIGLDEALERGYEDLKTASLVAFADSSSLQNGLAQQQQQQHLLRVNGAHTPQRLLSDTPPQRPSAELARATLGRSGGKDMQREGSGAGAGGGNAGVAVGINVEEDATAQAAGARRESTKSTHELEEIHHHHHHHHQSRHDPYRSFDDHRSATSSTWSPSAGNAFVQSAGAVAGAGAGAGANAAGMEHSNNGSGTLRGRRNVRNVDWTA